MTNPKHPYVPPPPEADGPYKYYLVAGFRAVRIEVGKSNIAIGADVADPDEPGVLKPRATLISTVMKGELAEEITKEQFVELFRRYAGQA